MSETWTCGRCGIADAGVLNLDTGNAYHPEWAHCVTALRQRLADVAYLEAWRAADLRRYVYSVAGGDAVRWIAVDPLTPTDVIAESVPALGARLRAIREEGGR